MQGFRFGVIAACAFFSLGLSVRAEDAAPSTDLSQVERDVLAGLIDKLHTGTDSDFASDLQRGINDVLRQGYSAKPMIGSLKASAGDRVSAVNDALSGLCRSASPYSKKTMCELLLVQAPDTANVQTAATGAAGGAGGAVGGALTSDSGSSGRTGGFAGGGDSATPNLLANFNFRGGTPGTTELLLGTNGGTTLQVPNPVAGAGLAPLLIVAGLYGWRRFRAVSTSRQ
jgi:hypothetical protein